MTLNSPRKENITTLLNATLADVEPPDWDRVEPEKPVTWIVGIPRSGSTVLSQLLAESGHFGYITNIIARFWMNPALGLQIQKALDPVLPDGAMSYESNLGNTGQWFAPHEFGYFWERHFPFECTHEPEDRKAERVEWNNLRREIARLEQGFDKPLFFKNLTLSLFVDKLAKNNPKAQFVEISRAPVAVANSLYRSRLTRFGTPDEWFSIRPSNYRQLQHKSPENQIISQMEAVTEHLTEMADVLDSDRWLQVDYRQLCRNPKTQIRAIADFCGCEALNLHRLPDTLDYAGRKPPNEAVNARFEEAIQASEVLCET